jgi:hypothetical protein
VNEREDVNDVKREGLQGLQVAGGKFCWRSCITHHVFTFHASRFTFHKLRDYELRRPPMTTLTSRERVLRAIRRQPTDCVAAMPYMYDIAAETAGIPVLEFCTDPQAMVRAQLALHEQVGQDVIAIGADNYYIAEGFGCGTTRNPDEIPAMIKPPLENIAEVFDLEVPDPQRDGRMPVMLEALKLARKAVGDTVALRSPGTGPFALASYFIGSQQWLLEIAMVEHGLEGANEEAVLHALELSTEALIRFGKACHDAGADILHCGDSLASCNVISPGTYQRFSWPYSKTGLRSLACPRRAELPPAHLWQQHPRPRLSMPTPAPIWSRSTTPLTWPKPSGASATVQQSWATSTPSPNSWKGRPRWCAPRPSAVSIRPAQAAASSWDPAASSPVTLRWKTCAP